MADLPLTSRIPYLFRAMYQWIVDNEQTPYVVADAKIDGTSVPSGYAVDDRIILNISQMAVEDLDMSNAAVSFTARFGGVAKLVYLPTAALLGIYAKESGEGMLFASDQLVPSDDDTPPPSGGGKPSLHVVK